LIEEVFPVHVDLLQRGTAALTVLQKREVSRLLRTLSQHAPHDKPDLDEATARG